MAWIQTEKNIHLPMSAFLLIALIFISALATIYVANQSRQLFTEYYRLQSLAQKFQDERAKLQLQESSSFAAYKILKKAQQELDMFVPETTDRLYLP